MTDLSFEALRPEYESLWAKVNAPGGLTRLQETNTQAKAILDPRAKARFVNVENDTGVPWFVTGIISTRESGSPPNFQAWLHNGDPMYDHRGKLRQTVDVPARRPPLLTLEAARVSDQIWEIGACDAYACEGLLQKTNQPPLLWSPARVAWVLEKMNGFGYRKDHHIRSPYLWGGTIVQQRGKYIRDHEWDGTVMDDQIGGMALLAALTIIAPDEVRFTQTETIGV